MSNIQRFSILIKKVLIEEIKGTIYHKESTIAAVKSSKVLVSPSQNFFASSESIQIHYVDRINEGEKKGERINCGQLDKFSG